MEKAQSLRKLLHGTSTITETILIRIEFDLGDQEILISRLPTVTCKSFFLFFVDELTLMSISIENIERALIMMRACELMIGKLIIYLTIAFVYFYRLAIFRENKLTFPE